MVFENGLQLKSTKKVISTKSDSEDLKLLHLQRLNCGLKWILASSFENEKKKDVGSLTVL